MENLNKELYSHRLFDEWAQKELLLPAEEYLLTTYLTDKTKRVVEAGTGGGRLILYVERMGFTSVDAFDFVPGLLETARSKAKQRNSRIRFAVADAANLDVYQNGSFDYLIYLQNMLCFVSEDRFLAALYEAHRIAKNDAIAIFSFLDWGERAFNPALSLAVNALRRLRGEPASKYSLPWLKLNGQPNTKFLSRNQPAIRWWRRQHILSLLEEIGFSILDVRPAREIDKQDRSYTLYVVCRKHGTGT